jgi:hypothetical protein
MITITSFTEAHHLYQQQHIPWRLLQDQAAVLIGTCQNQHAGVADARNVSKGDVAWLLQQPEAEQTYVDLLGGNVHVAQTPDDLLQVEGCNFEFAKQFGRWPNVTEVPLAFDDCKFLQETSGEAQWALLLTCWNDAGGSIYFLPRHLWIAARVAEHFAETNGYWQGNP